MQCMVVSVVVGFLYIFMCKLCVFLVLYILLDCIYTGWRKKNTCFSNNCNFVYFQYKKIKSTPKQPVINAVLITYINYSITENCIGKMASFLPYTQSGASPQSSASHLSACDFFL